MDELCLSYLNNVYVQYKDHDSTELSYYPWLSEFIKNISISEFKKSLQIIQNPSKVFHGVEIVGSPDFVVKNDDGDIVGYIEAKDPMVNDLESLYDSDQITRYRNFQIYC
jgi:hypothetical protein